MSITIFRHASDVDVVPHFDLLRQAAETPASPEIALLLMSLSSLLEPPKGALSVTIAGRRGRGVLPPPLLT